MSLTVRSAILGACAGVAAGVVAAALSKLLPAARADSLSAAAFWVVSAVCAGAFALLGRTARARLKESFNVAVIATAPLAVVMAVVLPDAFPPYYMFLALWMSLLAGTNVRRDSRRGPALAEPAD